MRDKTCTAIFHRFDGWLGQTVGIDIPLIGQVWLDGHNHDGNYGEHAGVHYLNLKAMLDTPETAYARLDFFADRVVVRGFGRQPDYVLPLRP